MKNEEIRRRRREIIFNAAIQCFNEKGYHGTSMSEIADRADITKRGLYYHFKSKDALFIELFHFRGRKYFERINAYIDEIEDPEKKIRLFTTKASRIIKEHEDFLRFFVEFMSIGARNPAVCTVMTKHYQDSIANFAKLLEAGIKAKKFKKHNSKKIARVIFLLSMGIFFTHYSLKTDFEFVDQHVFNLDSILQSIKPT